MGAKREVALVSTPIVNADVEGGAQGCPPPARARTPAGSTTGIGAGILKQLAAGGATTVMHGLVSEAEITAKAAAVQEQYGLPCGTSTADLLDPQAIR